MVPLTSTKLRNEPVKPCIGTQMTLPRRSGAVPIVMLGGSGLTAFLADPDRIGDPADRVGDRGLVVEADRVADAEPATGHRNLVAAAEGVGHAEPVLRKGGLVVAAR